MSPHPQDTSLREQARAIASGELDATELLEVTLARIEERNPALNAIVDVSANEAAQMLTEAPEGPLHGVPVVLKDMYALPWRAPRDGAARNLYGVGPGESAIYRRLRDAGAAIVGITNMHELGMGSTGHQSIYGPVGTPWDPTHCGGGSSGGSGSAVGARMVAGAVGHDGGGSIRYPASYCGVTGLKSTWGRMPEAGCTHETATLGVSGPICRDAADARLLASAMLGTPLSERRIEGMRIGVPRRFWKNIDPEVESACEQALAALDDAGLEIGEVEIGGAQFARIATVLLLALDTSPAQKPELFAEIQPDLSPVGRGLTKFPMLLPAPALARAQRVRHGLRRELARAFENFDLLAWPTTPAAAPPIDNPTVELPKGTYPADFANVAMGGIANLTGVPALSTPCGFTSARLPIGLHLVGPWGEDERLLDVAEAFERTNSREFVDALPPIAQQAAV